jgi:hypothetical protein
MAAASGMRCKGARRRCADGPPIPERIERSYYF